MWFTLELVKMDGYSNIYGPDNFSDEFCKYVLNMTPEQVFHADEIPKAAKRYVKWLQRSLTQLDSLGTATTALKNFEKLPGTEDIYSARYPNSQKNPRILYFYIQGQNIVLLYPFLEKNSGDYQRGIRVATTRKILFQAQWPLDEQ
mgnify:FL=1